MKKFLSFFIAAAMLLPNISMLTVSAADPASREVDPLQYTYEIIPLLEPFNEYFFVKTDNPHPESFRFSDKDSPYSETSVIDYDDSVYADVEYENENMWRVNGGYIFKSYTTNGGEVTLQVHESITEEEFNTEIYGTPDPEYTGYSPYHGMPVGSYDQTYEDSWGYTIVGYYKWVDTNVKITLPPLCDDCDYLIQNYATESDFFDNMDAVEKGFDSICLYSGSYIRGELYQSSPFWSVSSYTHTDQSFYIFSPYNRRDNGYLLASALYPFRYDSLGFPSMMAKVSQRLDNSSSYSWNDSYHWLIDVTYDSETRSYGGAGNGEGQGLSEDKINHVFSFGDKDESLTLAESRKLLDDYAAVEMEDDIPRDDALTWEGIYNTVGDEGAWAHVKGGYAYFYKKDDENTFSADEWGVGYSLYWGGSLGYASDTWVDGRYVGVNEVYIPDETFEDHPNSSILIKETVVPEITDYERTWDSETGKYIYSNVEVTTYNKKNVLYRYDSELQLWEAYGLWNDYINSFANFKNLAETGAIDEEYYNMLILTPEEAEEIVNNGNTNILPQEGYIFDGTFKPGTRFSCGKYGDYLTYFEIDKDDDGAYDYAYISDCDTNADEIEIPCKIDGLPVTEIGSNAFYNCKKLTNINIPDSVTSINNYAFYGCTGLTDITLPDSVTNIEESAFESCTGLKSIDIPESVNSIGAYAFTNCTSLTGIKINNPECDIYDSSLTISDTAVVYGCIGSTAQAYAKEYERQFMSLDSIAGDISGNGLIDLYDAIEVCRYIMGIRIFTDDEMVIADFDSNGVVDLYDAIGIAQYLLTLI